MRRPPLSLPHVDTGAFQFGPAGSSYRDLSHLTEAELLEEVAKLAAGFLDAYRDADDEERDEIRPYLVQALKVARDLGVASGIVLTDAERADLARGPAGHPPR